MNMRSLSRGRTLILRPSGPEDAALLYEAYHKPDFLRLFAAGRKVPESVEQMRRALRKRAQIPPERLGYLEWLIVHRHHGPLGLAALNDYRDHRAEYLIGLFDNDKQARGFGTEATMLVLELAFNTLGLELLYSFVYDYNLQAGEMLKRIDFVSEGQHSDKHAVTLHRYSLSAERFRASRVLRRYGLRLTGRDITLALPAGHSSLGIGVQKRELQMPAAFSCTYSPQFAALLSSLGCTLALSTYQAGKVILVSARDDKLIQLPRSFKKPMGLAVSGNRLAVAQQEEVTILVNAPRLAPGYPKQPNTYDGLYLPRTAYYTGELDIHDMAWGEAGLWAVSTRFSCLALLDEHYSFTPRWRPPFIHSLSPHDCCHLNGLALRDGKPAYVTALGDTDSPEGWRERKLNGGVLIDADSGETVLGGLTMPHSPRLYGDGLYFLAADELLWLDVQQGKHHVVTRLPGFGRGMARCGDYLFIGLSKLRHGCETFGDLPIAARKDLFCGIIALRLPAAQTVGSMRFVTLQQTQGAASCEEIYDVQVLPGLRRPGILNAQGEMFRRALSTPEECFWGR
ncbi:MAG: TIGR03032 family protein [Gammaproteobacteria bacterium]|nr:TIGR03032 family protein [Gammaproteobacteria bacterium]